MLNLFTLCLDFLLYMSIIIIVERRDTEVSHRIKKMKEIKGLPIEFVENGIEAKLNEIFYYRVCFYDELNSDLMKDTFELYSKDMSEDGYSLIREGIKKFYPNYCDVTHIEKVTKWYEAVEDMLVDLRINLTKYFNIKNPYIELRKRKEEMKENELHSQGNIKR